MSLFDKQIRMIAWAPVLFLMGIIFYLSHQPATASSELSSGITEMIVDILETVMPFIQIEMSNFHFWIRKSAHFFTYFTLGILVVNALSPNHFYKYRLALAICVAYAISDEAHQLFIPGRSGEVRDVLIDSAGALLGIVVYVLIRKIAHFIKR